MNIRRGIVALGVAIVMIGGTVVTASPASAVACGAEPTVTINGAKSHYHVSCKTLAGNIKAWTITGWVQDTNWDDANYARLDAVIGGTDNIAIALAPDHSLYTFTFTGSGPSAQVYTCVVNLYNSHDCIP
jgi:hypothetical protein